MSEQPTPFAHSMLFVMRLVQLHLKVTWHSEMRRQSLADILDLIGEFDTARFELAHGALNVVAIE